MQRLPRGLTFFDAKKSKQTCQPAGWKVQDCAHVSEVWLFCNLMMGYSLYSFSIVWYLCLSPLGKSTALEAIFRGCSFIDSKYEFRF